MKLLVADKFPDKQINSLKSSVHLIDYKPELGEDDLVNSIGSAEVLIVRSTRVNQEVIQAADELQVIIRAGAGVNTIDVKAAAENGIFVCNTPGKNAIAVAELAFGLLLAVDRQIPASTADLRQGQWNKKTYSKAQGLYGAKIGIIGLGEIGKAFAKRAAAFGLQLYCLKKSRSESAMNFLHDNEFTALDSLNDLAKTCDILSFHVPSNADTKGMVNKELLSHLAPGAIIINTARGEIMDEDALIQAMDEKGIRVGLDVYMDEPASGKANFSSALASHANVVGTHHIGASTEQAQIAIAEEVLRILAAFDQGELINCVNLEEAPPVKSSLIIRHYDKVGVLAAVLDVLKNAGINVEQMENQIFSGAKAACAVLKIDALLDEKILSSLEKLDHVIQVKTRK